MIDSDIYAIIKSLVGHKEDAHSRSPRSLIKQLLPIDAAFGYYLSNKVEFYDPIQDEVFYRNIKYDNEKLRLESIAYINGRIDYYNRLCDDEYAKNGAIYDYIDPIFRWGVKVKLSQSMLTNINHNSYSNPKETIHDLINWLDWEWSEKYLSPQKNKRSVFTASSAQVRKKINSYSSGFWKNYEDLLEPIIELFPTYN